MKCLICWKFIEEPMYKGVYVYPICSEKCFNKYKKEEKKKEDEK